MWTKRTVPLKIAGNGGLRRRRGLRRPVPRPEPLQAAPLFGFTGTAGKAGAFLSVKS